MRWLAAIFAWVVGSAVVYVSNLSFFVAGGSDSLTDIAAPPLMGQVLAVILSAAGLAYAAWRGAAGGPPIRAAAGAVACVLLLLATHRVVIDNGLGTMRDLWFLITTQTREFDQRDGPSAALSLEKSLVWDRIVPRTGGPAMILVRGIPPLALDMTVIEVWWTRQPG